MAHSPPRTLAFGGSLSPPFPTPSQLPSKKRPSEALSATAVKRRKPSLMSTTSTTSVHPLRQTSYPPVGTDISITMRSPSVDAASMVSGPAASAKKKRGRKSKKEDELSVAGGPALTAVSGISGRGKTAQLDEDDEDDMGDGTEVAVVSRTKEEKEKEKQHRAMLVEAFDPSQFNRYEHWRSSRLPDPVVRRLINQTLSQSVPASIILAVKSVAKIYAGEIIERARKVQSQDIKASGKSQTRRGSPPASDNEKDQRGPLTADHLREALRRHKIERDGGFVGLMGLGRLDHQVGAERFALKGMGKRILR